MRYIIREKFFRLTEDSVIQEEYGKRNRIRAFEFCKSDANLIAKFGSWSSGYLSGAVRRA